MDTQSRADEVMTKLVELAVLEASTNSTYFAATIMQTHGVPIDVAHRVLLHPKQRRNYRFQLM
jgi:hypothetical protein